MQIASLYASCQTSFYTETERPEKRQPLSSAGSKQGDTVALSAESLSLAAAMKSRAPSEMENSAHGDSQEHATNGQFQASQRVGSGMRVSEKDLYVQIQQAEEDVHQLGQELAQILDGPEPMAVKASQSQPVQKRLQERVEELQALKAEVQALKENKQADSRIKTGIL